MPLFLALEEQVKWGVIQQISDQLELPRKMLCGEKSHAWAKDVLI